MRVDCELGTFGAGEAPAEGVWTPRGVATFSMLLPKYVVEAVVAPESWTDHV